MAVTGTPGWQRPTPARRAAIRLLRRRERWGLAFVSPFLVLFVLFTLLPLLYAIGTSLFTDKLVGGTAYSGLDNYRTVLKSTIFWSGVGRVLLFAVIQIPIMLALAFFFATMFDLGIARFGSTLR